MEQLVKINMSFVAKALRYCGYDLYTAIADIIDNSIEENVQSQHVKVFFDTVMNGKNKEIASVMILDDGSGMKEEVLHEAMALGSETGKNPEHDLGTYGTGLKSSSISIGRTLEVFTKTLEDDFLNYARFSLDEYNDEGFYNTFCRYDKNSQEYLDFKAKVNSESGTIIKITNLDRGPKTYYSVIDTMKKYLGKVYNKFLKNNVFKLYVMDEEVLPVNVMGNLSELLKSGTFEVDGHKIGYNVYCVPLSKEKEKEDSTDYDGTGMRKSGFYIYRNYRLVGDALTLGFFNKHSTHNNFRCEIFVDGTCDNLFGSTFNKIIHDGGKEKFSQSFNDSLGREIGPAYSECERRYNKSQKKDPISPEEKEAQKAFYNEVTKAQNDNRFLLAKKMFGINEKHEETKEEKEKQERGKQKNPNPHRTRNDGWLGGYEEQHAGTDELMFWSEPKNNKAVIVINKDHPFYDKIYSSLGTETKFYLAQALSCIEIAKQNMNYYSEETIKECIDMFTYLLSSEVRKSLKI